MKKQTSSMWPAVDAARLRHRIAVEQPSASVDSVGQQSSTWSMVCQSWAEIIVATQREQYQTGALASDVTHVITMRYRAGIAAGMRVVYGSHIYRVQAINNVEERNVVLKLLCLEVNGTT